MTATAGDLLPTPVSDYTEAGLAYHAMGWPCVLPLALGTKFPPPQGFTGWGGADTSAADICELAEVPRYRGTMQTALRMPDTIIGVDVDHYGTKRGGDTLIEAERRWGPLPAGPWSSARDDGVSGIRFFRVPAGTVLAGGIAFPELNLDGDEAGIEVVQLHHRYAVVWPSIHPDTGTPYTWRATAGPGLGPAPEECPDLPPAWVEGLRNDSARPGRLAATDFVTDAFLAEHTAGSRSWAGPITAFRTRHGGRQPNRHDSMRNSLCWIAREAAAGQYPAEEAFAALWRDFWASVRDDGKRTEATARIEFDGAVRYAVGQLAGLTRDEAYALTADARRPPRSITSLKLTRGSASTITNENDGVADEPAEVAEASDSSTADETRARKIAERLEALEIDAEARRLYAGRHQPPAEMPAPVLLNELLDWPVDPVRYRIDGLLGVGGRALLAAAHKAGKTTLMGNLVRCLVDGGQFLGRHTTEPVNGRVVLLDTELPQRLLQDWLGRQGIKNTDQVAVISLRDRVTSFNLTDPVTLVRWAELIAPLDPAFVVLDCLRPVLDACGLSESNETGRFLVPFSELLGRLAVAEAVLVQHMGHSAERARGDSALLAWPDVNWKIVRGDAEDDRSTRYFSAFGRDVDAAEAELGFNSMTGELSVIGGGRREGAARDALSELLTLLARSPGMSGQAIEEAHSGSRSAVRQAVKLAEQEHRIKIIRGDHNARLHYLSDQHVSSSNQFAGELKIEDQ